MNLQDVIYAFIAGIVSVIAFFLVRFYYLVDELRKDVKQLLIQEAGRGNAIENIKEDVKDIKATVHEHDKKLNHLELEVAKLQN